MAYREGQWKRDWYQDGADSQLHGVRHNNNTPLSNIDRISLGSVLLPQPEPLFNQHTVSVNLVTGGLLTNVAWPGAQVNANATGTIPGGLAIGIHGLWESPLPGQMVLVGYVDGSSGNPIVINKYPYNAENRPDLEVMHKLPLTQQLHGPTDIVLGHHTSSYFALRGTLPLPGAIEIFSPTSISINSLLTMDVSVLGQYTVSVKGLYEVSAIGGITIDSTLGVDISATTDITISGLTSVAIESNVEVSLDALTINITGLTTSIESSTAPLTITATPAVVINSGVRPVAALGDVTPTLLGPSPIAATGISCLV